MITKRQGESYSASYKRPGITDMTGYGGTWVLTKSLSSTPVASGILYVNPADLTVDLEVTNSHTESVPVDTYILIVQIINTSTGYDQEIHEDFTIKPQGIKR